MPRTNRPPAYRLQKARQCAVVSIHGKDHYLGPYGSPESHEKYARLIARWNAGGRQAPTAILELPSNGQVTVNAITYGQNTETSSTGSELRQANAV